MTGAQALIKSLEMQGVDVMFGLPGGAILPVYDPIIDSSIRHILVRHEQGAGHMAEGYAMVTGRPGVAMVTSGPGATNIVTPLANAYMDSTPLIVVVGPGGDRLHRHRRLPGVRHHRRHHGHHQAQLADQGRGRHPAGGRRRLPRCDHRAAGAGPDRPAQGHLERHHGVVLAVVGRRPRPAGLPPGDLRRPRAGRPGGRAHLARRTARSSTSGAVSSRRGPPRRCGRWPSAPGIPVVTTLMARGAFPDSHPQALGHARHARPLHRGDRHAAERPPDQPRALASTTASPARSAPSRPTPRSSTSTSIRPSWARCACPTSASRGTAAG